MDKKQILKIKKTSNIFQIQVPGKQLQEQERYQLISKWQINATNFTFSSDFIHGNYSEDSVRACALEKY